MKKKHPKYFQEMSIPLFSVSFVHTYFSSRINLPEFPISIFEVWKKWPFSRKTSKSIYLIFWMPNWGHQISKKLATLMPSPLLLLLLKSSWKRFWNILGFSFQKCAFNYNSFSNEKMLALQLSTAEICVHLAWREAEIVVKLKIRPKHAIKVESSW